MAQTDMVRTQKAPFRRLVCSSRSDSWEILLILCQINFPGTCLYQQLFQPSL